MKAESAARLVLLHPVGQDEDCWQYLEIAVPLHAHLFPGHGKRPRSPMSLGEMADEVASNVQGPMDVVGVAMGGIVGLHLLVRHPERVRSAVLACTHAQVNREVLLNRAQDTESRGMRAMLGETLRRWFTEDALTREIPGVKYARDHLLAMDARACGDAWRAMAEHDVRNRLDAIEVPVTLVAGRFDRSTPVAEVRALQQRLPNSRLEVVDAPHMIHLERPELLKAAIDQHQAWLGARMN